MGNTGMLICNRQELKPCLEPKFSSWVCSLDLMYCLPCLSLIQAESFSRYKERTPGICEKRNWGGVGGFFFCCVFTLGLTRRQSISEFPYQPPSSFLFRAEFGTVLSPAHFEPPHFFTPQAPLWCSRAGRKGGGGECHWQLPPRVSWLCFICKASEEAREFPEAPSSWQLQYQHLAKVLLNFSSFQILTVPVCFLAVPSHFLACIRLGRRRREHQGLMSEGLLDE